MGDSFPIPNIQDIWDQLGRATYFSAQDCASDYWQISIKEEDFSIQDCASGYWQISIKEEDKCKTAFSAKEGHFESNALSIKNCTCKLSEIHELWASRIVRNLLFCISWRYSYIFGKSEKTHTGVKKVIWTTG